MVNIFIYTRLLFSLYYRFQSLTSRFKIQTLVVFVSTEKWRWWISTQNRLCNEKYKIGGGKKDVINCYSMTCWTRVTLAVGSKVTTVRRYCSSSSVKRPLSVWVLSSSTWPRQTNTLASNDVSLSPDSRWVYIKISVILRFTFIIQFI